MLSHLRGTCQMDRQPILLRSKSINRQTAARWEPRLLGTVTISVTRSSRSEVRSLRGPRIRVKMRPNTGTRLMCLCPCYHPSPCFNRTARTRILLVALALLSTLGCTGVSRPPEAHEGELNLSAWHFVRDGSVALTGQWDLYWERLLDPAELTRAGAPRPDGWMTLPGAWTRVGSGAKRIPTAGVATFRLRLRLPAGSRPLALWIEEQTASYRLWFNGSMVAQGGDGPWPAASGSGLHPRIVVTEPGHQRADVVLQVAGSAAYLGGPTQAILLGDPEVLGRERRTLRDLDALLFGSLMVMGLYHAGLFLLRRRERPALYIALICVSFGARIPFNGLSGRPLTDYAAGLSVELYSKADALTVVLGVTAILLYVGSVLRDRSAYGPLRFLAALAAGFAVLVLVLPRRISETMTILWFVVAACICCYVLFVSLRAGLRGERVGWFLVAGWGMLASVGLTEIITDLLSPTGNQLPLVPFGVFAFLLLQAWVIVHRLYAAFLAVETVSGELQLTNANLRRLELLKDEFLANTSHELRTPVHGIVGLSEALLQGAAGTLTKGAQESLELIVSSGRRLGTLISDLLDLTRLRRDDIGLTLGPVDLRALGSAVVGLLEPVARAKGLVLINRIGERPTVQADENRLHQVLLNLVDNAIKYTDRGEVSLSAKEVGHRVELVVTDTGSGIPVTELDRIFERAERLERSPRHGTPGAGLGLAIARKLVDLHGGTIRAENSPLGGSRFIVELPTSSSPPVSDRIAPSRAPFLGSGDVLRATESAPPEQQEAIRFGVPARVSRSEPSPGPMARVAGHDDPLPSSLACRFWREARVLVVDDDPVNLRVVESHLRMAGAEVYSEHSGIDALNLLAEREDGFDLMLVDVMMPGLNGYEVTGRVRERYAASELPVILLTARGTASDVLHGFEAGANDYLVKPFSSAELLARGMVHLGLRRAYRALKDKVALEQELERQRCSAELARLCVERERLEKLRYQLNPHLLFNALASIRGAILSDAEAARDMVGILGEFCRMTLLHAQRDLLPLGEELTIARLYLSMDQARRRDPIDIEWETAPGLDATLVPTFLLQPLIENAVKYGRLTCPAERLRVRLSVAPTIDGAVVVCVSNTGMWLEPNPARPGSLGVGLENVRARLNHHFGCLGALSTTHDDGWVHVSVTIPGSPSQ